MPRVVISSYVMCYPVGGFMSWTLQWLLGMHRLGCDVYFVEKAGSWPKPCVDLGTLLNSDDCTVGIAAFRSVLERFGLKDRFCFVDGREEYFGMTRNQVEDIIVSADVFIEMGGGPFLDVKDTWMAEASRVPLRVLIDSEPGYTQMKMSHRLAKGVALHDYNRFYSVGLNLGSGASRVPLLGVEWKPIVDPVVLDLFTVAAPPDDAPFTTIMNWESHATVEYDGIRYGQKNLEFEKFFELPSLVPVPLEIAATGARLPIDRLRASGWRVRDSYAVTGTFDAWRSYIEGSRGEFAVAKNVFVATHSGFFSDRSAAYLASGRPVVMQDTGFSAHLPCGEGLFAVSTMDEAAGAILEITADYARHSRAARGVAEEYLDASKVLNAFLQDLGVA